MPILPLRHPQHTLEVKMVVAAAEVVMYFESLFYWCTLLPTVPH
jgi:hypothetical protein